MATWTPLVYAFGSLLTSNKMTLNQANFEAMAQGASGAPRILGTDNWYRMDGLDGSLTVNSDTTIHAGVYHYTFVQVNSGKTLTVNSGGGLVLSCSSRFILDGTIDLVAQGGGTGGAPSGGDGDSGASGTGGGGGGGNLGGEIGGEGGFAVYLGYVNSGGSGGAILNNGSNGSTLPQSRSLSGFDAANRFGGGGGGGGGINGGDGGDAGGAIVVASPSVTINSLGIIDCSGGDGGNGTANGDGGGGGGGAGYIQLITSAESYTNTGSFSLTGGTGGTGDAAGGDGGTGGSGLSEVIQLT